MLFDLARRHSGVAVCLAHPLAKPLLLPFARRADALANRGGIFLRAFAGDVAIFHRRHFDVQIDAIEQRTGNALAITLHLHRAATAFAFQIAEISAGTGIHRRDEHELGRKSDTAGGARDRDSPSSSGWRITSRVERLNSGSSSRKRTPLCARLTSPGAEMCRRLTNRHR